MRRFALGVLLTAAVAAAQPFPEPLECPFVPLSPQICDEGSFGDRSEGYESLTRDEVEAIVRAAAGSLDVNMMRIAVVDRAGRVLALFRKSGVSPDLALDDLAVGTARTAAFFSHNMAPLSSRTVRFISGIHFPPGITNTPSAALYGIENTNRGCDFNVVFNTGKCVPRARSLNNRPCRAGDPSGCGTGIVTGKVQPNDADSTAVNAGGIPLYRILDASQIDEGRVSNGKLLGGIGVVGVPGDPQLAEFAAVSGAFGAAGIVPVPQFPLPSPGNVFIDGIRLPFLGPDIRLEFNNDGLPTGPRRLAGTSAGSSTGTFAIGPNSGDCAANEYLVDPKPGPVAGLSEAEVRGIVERSIIAAKRTRAAIRLPLNTYARMVIAVADVDGTILALYRMPDATVFSIDVAVTKARNVVYFASNQPTVQADIPGVPPGTAVSARTINFASQPLFPSGIDSRVFNVREGPFYRTLFLRDLANPCSQGTQPLHPNQSGIVFFAGSTPLYRGNALIGGLGISGDGVEQDDYVTFLGAGPFLPDTRIWADRVRIDRVRLPMFKFPRQPEGVRECDGGPCS